MPELSQRVGVTPHLKVPGKDVLSVGLWTAENMAKGSNDIYTLCPFKTYVCFLLFVDFLKIPFSYVSYHTSL